MDVMVTKGCGLDVHQDTVVACVVVGEAGRKTRKEVRTFPTVKKGLEALATWLVEQQITHVAMESTGVYWMPVYVALEDRFTLVVGNASHVKNVPGRKTDVKDCEWLASLLRHGLVRSSYVPPKELRGLRELTRQRRKFVHTQASMRNRLIKLLEQAGIKIASFVTDVFGVSGREFVRAIIDGKKSPAEMAQLAKGQLRRKLHELELALDGNVSDDHRFLLGLSLDAVEQIETVIEKLDIRIREKLVPYEAELALLKQIPGIDLTSAASLIGEMGVDMSIFHSAQHAAAWSGVCPGNNRSAGKAKRETTRAGNIHMTTTLVQAAASSTRKKGSYLQAKYVRLKSRRGAKRALMAIAHKILIAAYHVLRDRVGYKDLGGAYLDNLRRAQTARTLRKRLEAMGYDVTVQDRLAQVPPTTDGDMSEPDLVDKSQQLANGDPTNAGTVAAGP